MRASFMTTIRSAIDSASSGWVTWMNISPSWRWRLRARRACGAAAAGRGRRGLVEQGAFGLVTSTRAAPVAAAAERALACGRRAREADHLERVERLPRHPPSHPCILRPELDVLGTVRCGKSAKCWNTVVVGAWGASPTSDWPSAMSPSDGFVAADHAQRGPAQPVGRADDVLTVVDVQVDVLGGVPPGRPWSARQGPTPLLKRGGAAAPRR
jgi:hypothetical protein